MFDKLKKIEERYHELNELLSSPEVISNQNKFRELSKEQRGIEEIVRKFEEYKKKLSELDSVKEMLETFTDAETKEMAQLEFDDLQIRIPKIEEELKTLLIPKDPNDDKNCIVEIRAGTGGEESALFVADLFRMNSRFAEKKRWQMELLDWNDTGLGGFKEVIFQMSGDNAFGSLKFESGVHRVQRVPETESQGRIHTSAAGVLVLPEADEIDVELNMNDVRVDVYRSSGPGGQSVNTTDSAVRLTHIPTGIVVSCQNEKSQLQNKESALRILRARMLAAAQEAADAEAAATRKSQVRTVDRSERIRTYNFPENRLTDHRVNFKANNLDAVLNGELDEVIGALLEADKSEKLAAAEA